MLVTTMMAIPGQKPLAKPLNHPLDTNLPVVMLTPNSFSFDGKTYLLDERHLLVDATVYYKWVLAGTLLVYVARHVLRRYEVESFLHLSNLVSTHPDGDEVVIETAAKAMGKVVAYQVFDSRRRKIQWLYP